jgi:hypothetical protein
MKSLYASSRKSLFRKHYEKNSLVPIQRGELFVLIFAKAGGEGLLLNLNACTLVLRCCDNFLNFEGLECL